MIIVAYKKVCPKCEKISYCASNNNEWICPYCGKDISDIEID